MACKKENSRFQIPTNPEGKAKYELAMRHVERAKEAGKSAEEIHEIFRKVMEGDGTGCCGKCKK